MLPVAEEEEEVDPCVCGIVYRQFVTHFRHRDWDNGSPASVGPSQAHDEYQSTDHESVAHEGEEEEDQSAPNSEEEADSPPSTPPRMNLSPAQLKSAERKRKLDELREKKLARGRRL